MAGNLQSEYVFFDGERMARKDFPGTTVSYYFSDHLKTAAVITDSAGTIKISAPLWDSLHLGPFSQGSATLHPGLSSGRTSGAWFFVLLATSKPLK